MATVCSWRVVVGWVAVKGKTAVSSSRKKDLKVKEIKEKVPLLNSAYLAYNSACTGVEPERHHEALALEDVLALSKPISSFRAGRRQPESAQTTSSPTFPWTARRVENACEGTWPHWMHSCKGLSRGGDSGRWAGAIAAIA